MDSPASSVCFLPGCSQTERVVQLLRVDNDSVWTVHNGGPTRWASVPCKVTDALIVIDSNYSSTDAFVLYKYIECQSTK